MSTVALPFLLGLLLLGQQTFETGARIIQLDPEKRSLQVTAGGQARTVPVAGNARILDRDGKDLKDGLKSPELKPGVDVTLRVERGEWGPIVREIRLGLPRGADQGAAIPRVDTSGLTPLTELGEKSYKGFPGGLYPGGKNERPAGHDAAGAALAKTIRPLDAGGRPSPDGKIVLLSVGMSNTTQEFSAFKALADASPQKNPRLVVVDGAQGGMTAKAIQDPDDQGSGTRYWTTVDQRLTAAGASRAQVQAVWIKQADAGPNQGFPAYAQQLQAELGRIVRLLHTRFPNLKIAYLSSRTYGGYARTPLNPEPYAYESGFSVRWLIEQQLKGDPELNFDPAKGAVRAPWLSWGPYLWANGSRHRADGFSYEEGDFGPDGTHPSDSGRRKVANLLLTFLSTDTTSKGWFLR